MSFQRFTLNVLIAFALILVEGASLSHAATNFAVTVDDLPIHGALPPGSTRLQVAEKMHKVLKKVSAP